MKCSYNNVYIILWYEDRSRKVNNANINKNKSDETMLKDDQVKH